MELIDAMMEGKMCVDYRMLVSLAIGSYGSRLHSRFSIGLLS